MCRSFGYRKKQRTQLERSDYKRPAATRQLDPFLFVYLDETTPQNASKVHNATISIIAFYFRFLFWFRFHLLVSSSLQCFMSRFLRFPSIYDCIDRDHGSAQLSNHPSPIISPLCHNLQLVAAATRKTTHPAQRAQSLPKSSARRHPAAR